jgi:hypothetical protein
MRVVISVDTECYPNKQKEIKEMNVEGVFSGRQKG